MLVRIFISAVLFLAVVLMPLDGVERIAAFIVPYLVIGWDVLWKAIAIFPMPGVDENLFDVHRHNRRLLRW